MPTNPPKGYHTVTPVGVVPEPDMAIAFVVSVLGGTLAERYEQDGKVIHAEVIVGDSRLMFGAATDGFPVMPLMTHTYVADVDAVYKAALAHGAVSSSEPEDQFYGDRVATVADPQGNVWSLATPIEDLSAQELEQRASERYD